MVDLSRGGWRCVESSIEDTECALSEWREALKEWLPPQALERRQPSRTVLWRVLRWGRFPLGGVPSNKYGEDTSARTILTIQEGL